MKGVANSFSKSQRYLQHRFIQEQVEKKLLLLLEQTMSDANYHRVRALEVGCVGSTSTRWLLDRYSLVEGVDISEGQGLRAMQQYPELQFRVADIAKEELPPNQFDLIFSSMCLHWVDSLEQTVAKLFNALAPGGVLAYALPLQDSLKEISATLQERYGYMPINQFPNMLDARIGIGFDARSVDYACFWFEQRFESMKLFFEHFRTTGTNTYLGESNLAMRASKLRQVLSQEVGEVNARYQIGFIIAVKEG
ncbi:MAG: methyltransferase domain-containing protein [Methylacidiphilales bacterium]|nr:methyltransferase domain-containing protein [Candidatus Methylacidiphilales bacterium]